LKKVVDEKTFSPLPEKWRSHPPLCADSIQSKKEHFALDFWRL
jgi:hypothetical protein